MADSQGSDLSRRQAIFTPLASIITDYDGRVKGLVTGYDWDRAADIVLASVEGLTDAEAASRWGVSEGTIRRWRKLRRGGEHIPEPRSDPRRALLRAIGETEESYVHANTHRRSDSLVVREDYRPADYAEAERWLSEIINPDLLRRQAGTPTGRDIILGIKSFLFDLDWPVEQKNAVDALLNEIAANAQARER